ncbi:MAG: MarR family winged helix-turn-helix transcriptional regulator [Pseudomonadota bacterium]
MSKLLAAQEIANCTCLRLRRTARRVSQIYDRMLAPADLTLPQFSLIAHLYAGEGLSVGDLAEALDTDPTTLTRNLKPLTERGLVRVVQDGEDRRRRVIALTSAGKALMPAAYPLWRKAQAHVAHLLGESETARLNVALDRSLARLTDDF